MSNKQFENSLCESSGHDWRRTTADNYQVCQRAQCHAARRLVSGAWRDVPSRKLRRTAVTEPENLLLWDDRTLLTHGIHPRQFQIEREAEQGYHRFLSAARS